MIRTPGPRERVLSCLKLGEHGVRRAAWDELAIVAHWRGFPNRPESYLRSLLR